MDGFNEALKVLETKYKKEKYQIIKKFACSSAKGGLKMITIGLVPELTVEAGKRAALGAGARVLKAYSYELQSQEIAEIKNSNPDIILLSGGTDGGNKKIIIDNARKIAKHFTDIPIIVAGNKCAYDEISAIFTENKINYILTDNVMPKLNELNVLPVREKIREVFMKNIIKSKGMDKAEKYIDGILMPTPLAVLKAGEILSQDIGDLIIVDIGGDDGYSFLTDGYPSNQVLILRTRRTLCQKNRRRLV